MLHIARDMTADPGSVAFALVALFVLSFVAILIQRYYLPLRTTPAYLLVPVFFALWLPAGIILLVPVDLASSARTDDVASRGVWLPDRVLLVSWRITYWLTFVLTWFILPILAEYSDAGYREPKDRLLYSLRSNGQYHAMVFGSGFIGLIYFFFSYGFHLVSVKGLIMALAYCWGLILAIYLMGHGLVAIPRKLLKNASVSGRLRRIQGRAPRAFEKMEESETALEELEYQVSELSRRKTGSAAVFQDWIEELVDMANQPEAQPRSGATRALEADGRLLPTVITEKYLADLTRQLVRAQHAKSRYLDDWNRLLQDAAETQAIQDSASSRKLEFGSASPTGRFWDRFVILTPYTRYILHYQAMPYMRIVLGGILAFASASIIWSELVKFLLPKASIIRISVVHHWTGETGQVGFAGQVIAAFWILYMCAAAFTSITEVKVWRGRALVRRNTAHESAFWYSSQVARLSVPLSYNFMTFLSKEIYTKTKFYDFLGRLINLTPLGTWFDYVFPMLILIPVCATLFGLYGKVKRFFGFGDIVGGDDEEDDENPTSAYGTGSWREGRDLIERELNGTSIRQRWREAGGETSAPGRAAPVRVVPGARRSDNDASSTNATTPFATSPSNPAAAPPPSRRALGSRLPELEDDDNFFSQLGHRMKNTMDDIQAPKWFQDIKKPKWMGGDDDDAGAGAGSSNARQDDDGFRRWFGGGNDDGRIRL